MKRPTPQKLTIRDLALYKQDPEKYWEKMRRNKTHDGTSMGGLRKIIQDFSQKYALEKDKHMAGYDSNGNEISHVQRPHWYEGLPDPIKLPKEILEQGKDLDIISNFGGTDEMIMGNCAAYPMEIAWDYKKTRSSFNRFEYDTLTQKNEEGEYAVRSITTVSPDGSSMTLLRNNEFNKTNEQSYESLTQTFHKDLKGYEKQCKQDYDEIYGQLLDEGIEPYAAEKQAKKQVLKKNGDMHEFIKDKNYPELFEEECNVKLRLRSTEINTAKPPKNSKPDNQLNFDDIYNNEMGWTDDDLGDKLFIDDDGYITDGAGNRYGKYE